MNSEEEVQTLVEHWVKYCIDYVESGKIEKKKSIKGLDRTELEKEIGGPCITCKEKMVRNVHKKGVSHLPNSFTAEHIVPRTLGGNNVRTNLVAMCHDCNRARGIMVTKLLPDLNVEAKNSIRGKPLSALNRSKISQFVEWAIRSIRRPLGLDSELCQLFNEIRSKEVHPLGSSTLTESASGTNTSSELLDILNQILETQKEILEHLQKSPLSRFREWFFGFFMRKNKPKTKKVKGSLNSVTKTENYPFITCTIKTGILGFSTMPKKSQKSFLMPRDPRHTLLFLTTLSSLNLKSKVREHFFKEGYIYREALGMIRSEIGKTYPARSDVFLMQKLQLMRNHLPDDIVHESYSNFKPEELVTMLHQFFIEQLIPNSADFSISIAKSDIPKVNEYFHSIGSIFKTQPKPRTHPDNKNQSENPIRLVTEMKIGISNFTTKNGIRFPRDPKHLHYFIKTLLRVGSPSINYRETLAIIRKEVDGIKPGNADLRVMRSLSLCFNQEPDQLVSEKILKSSPEVIISSLHKYLFEETIPDWDSPIDTHKVNEYFHSIGSIFTPISTVIGDDQVTVIDDDHLTRKISFNPQQKIAETAKIPGLNTATNPRHRSICFPLDPMDLSRIITHIETLRGHEVTKVEIVESCMQEFPNLPKSRITNSISRIRGAFEIRNDMIWSEYPSPDKVFEVLSQFVNALLEEETYSWAREKSGGDKIFFDIVEGYFSSTKSILSDERPPETATEKVPKPAPKQITVTQAPDQPFEQVRDFNTSSRGMKLPREPSDTAKIILHTQAALRNHDLAKTSEVTDYVHQKTGFSRSRTSKAVDYCLQDYRTTFDNKTAAASDYEQCPSQEDLAQKLESKESQRHEECDYSEEEIGIIRLYFANVRFHIAANG